MNRFDTFRDVCTDLLRNPIRPQTKQLCELALSDDEFILAILSLVTTVCYKHPEFLMKLTKTVLEINEKHDSGRTKET